MKRNRELYHLYFSQDLKKEFDTKVNQEKRILTFLGKNLPITLHKELFTHLVVEMVALSNAISRLDSSETKFRSSFICSSKDYLLFISVLVTIAKEDSKMKTFRKEHLTCREYKEVLKYKTQQVFKGEKSHRSTIYEVYIGMFIMRKQLHLGTE